MELWIGIAVVWRCQRPNITVDLISKHVAENQVARMSAAASVGQGKFQNFQAWFL